MRLSKKFISDYIDIHDIDMKELAEKMVFAGNEYEEMKPFCEATNLVIGEVLECVDHPESDHLHICQVNLGDETVQIVCGAPNVRKGLKVIVSKVGATLPGGIVIKNAKLAGVESNGMICALAELGLESKYLKEEDKNGIHELPNDAPVGDDALAYLEFDDTIIDFELTADRADLMNMIGMAYEVGAIYDRPVTVKEPVVNEQGNDITDDYQLDVETENCSIYLGKCVSNVSIKESPQFIKERLMACGIRPINNVVDISNYVMLEYGQPLHFFDADRLGKHIVVRMAKEEETLTTLDGQIRELKSSDIVIANEKEAVALAGVMGGLSTEVEEDTKNIFIEAAIFDPVHIRYTSKAILRSEASSRYEKGIDPNRTKQAILRACELLEKYAGGITRTGMLCHDQAIKEDKKIDITLEKINQVLGMKLESADVESILKRLGFTYNVEKEHYHVTVPTRRLDVNIKEDLIEEIGRIYGYDHVSGKLPVVPMKQGTYPKKEKMIKEIRKRLEGLGFYQVITYSLVGDSECKQFVNQMKTPVAVLAPLSEDKKVMRQTLIPSLLNVMEYNLARNVKDIQIFETGSIYYQEEHYVEEQMLSGLLLGNYQGNTWQNQYLKVDFYLVKGVIENLLNYLGLNGRYQIVADENYQDMHPKMTASILVDHETVGYFGKVHPRTSKRDVYVFEISLDKLLEKKVRQVKYKEISKYPSVHKDLAFIMPKAMESEQVMSILKKVGGRLLTNIDVFDVYEGENVGADEKSIAYALTFQNATKTLSDEEVTTIFNQMISEVESKLKIKLRNK